MSCFCDLKSWSSNGFCKNENAVISYFSWILHYPTLWSFSEFIIKKIVRIWIHLVVWLGRICLQLLVSARPDRSTVLLCLNTTLDGFEGHFTNYTDCHPFDLQNVLSPWTVNQMATPALKTNPARDMRICLLTHFRVHLTPSPTSAFPATWSQYTCNKLEMLRYH